MFLFIHVDWQVCWKCEATKGSADLVACYTNLRDDASWRASMWQNLPWSQTPEFAMCICWLLISYIYFILELEETWWAHLSKFW